MKFMIPKTGEIFNDIGEAIVSYCVGRLCDRCRLGESGKCLAKYYKANEREAAKLIGYEIIEEEETMEKNQDKPRICDVLGVEVGEEFEVPNPFSYCGCGPETMACYIDKDGNFVDLETNRSHSLVLLEIINHPEKIIRKTKFTDAEITIFKTIGAKWASRDEDCENVHFWDEEPCKNVQYYTSASNSKSLVGFLPASSFPSITPGSLVDIEKVLNAR